eukprot:7380955-Pyramimonas_sp.AAC.1
MYAVGRNPPPCRWARNGRVLGSFHYPSESQSSLLSVLEGPEPNFSHLFGLPAVPLGLAASCRVTFSDPRGP